MTALGPDCPAECEDNATEEQCRACCEAWRRAHPQPPEPCQCGAGTWTECVRCGCNVALHNCRATAMPRPGRLSAAYDGILCPGCWCEVGTEQQDEDDGGGP